MTCLGENGHELLGEQCARRAYGRVVHAGDRVVSRRSHAVRVRGVGRAARPGDVRAARAPEPCARLLPGERDARTHRAALPAPRPPRGHRAPLPARRPPAAAGRARGQQVECTPLAHRRRRVLHLPEVSAS